MTTEADNSEEMTDEVCASCGKAEVDDVKLKKCACNLVKYCSADCQKNHRPQHKKACKKRMAKIREDRLFTQPDGTHLGECPLCCLPLSNDENKRALYTCCSKLICDGCCYANIKREIGQGLQHKCPYCREPLPKEGDEQHVKNYTKRIEANDPIALICLGDKYDDEGNYEKAFEYYRKAAELGNLDGHYNLSLLYEEGKGVEKYKKKEVYHLEEAAIGGHLNARYNLGVDEANNGRYERAVKHFIIAAKLGDDDASDKLKIGFAHGLVSKEEYAAALRGHQAAVDATKSQQREKAEQARRLGLY